MVENLHGSPRLRKSDEERVRDFQRKLYRKAKEEPEFRFYVLYDKVRLPHMLRVAYQRCRRNHGGPGVDGQTFEDIERTVGVEAFLEDLRQQLETRTYRPSAVKRTYVPKANGKQRPLGIPTVTDRVAQMACKMVIEPIYEADFQDVSFGFRPKRSAADAVTKIREHLGEGRTAVFDADLSAYFDTIPHHELLTLVARRISDRNVIHLIKMWLQAPIWEDGRPHKHDGKGTPQGGVISPLLANIYMNLVDRAVKREGGVFHRNGVHIVRYADDFILMGRHLPDEVLNRLRHLLARLKLTLNEEKTRTVNAEEESFQFLGFTFEHAPDLLGRPWRYWRVSPSKKAVVSICANLREYLHHHRHLNPVALSAGLNPLIRGWMRYYTIPGVSYPRASFRAVRWYLMDQLYRFYRRKSQRRCKLYNQGAFRVLVERHGLIDPTGYART